MGINKPVLWDDFVKFVRENNPDYSEAYSNHTGTTDKERLWESYLQSHRIRFGVFFEQEYNRWLQTQGYQEENINWTLKGKEKASDGFWKGKDNYLVPFILNELKSCDNHDAGKVKAIRKELTEKGNQTKKVIAASSNSEKPLLVRLVFYNPNERPHELFYNEIEFSEPNIKFELVYGCPQIEKQCTNHKNKIRQQLEELKVYWFDSSNTIEQLLEK